ncbi:MAG: hypothetical protein CMI30_01205 [Opitutae bacterium]|nr:hypothetical protein [Opitutae bacterium]|tara:strand:- start:1732 stop:1926 length:195 start_codon:yes stop_codon:yes gene_type:complete
MVEGFRNESGGPRLIGEPFLRKGKPIAPVAKVGNAIGPGGSTAEKNGSALGLVFIGKRWLEGLR